MRRDFVAFAFDAKTAGGAGPEDIPPSPSSPTAVSAVDIWQSPPKECRTESSTRPPVRSLDSTPYRLSATVFAAGIRWKCWDTFPAGESQTTYFYLVRAGGVMSGETLFESEIELSAEQRGPNDSIQSMTNFLSLPTQTNGYSDIRTIKTTNVSPRVPTPGRVSTSTKDVTTYTWSGRHYEKAP